MLRDAEQDVVVNVPTIAPNHALNHVTVGVKVLAKNIAISVNSLKCNY